MIQRIQTIYLFLAAVASLLTIFLPLACFNLEDKVAMLYSFPREIDWTMVYSLLFFSVIAVLIAFIAIFAYKNRKRQMKWCSSLILANVLFYVCYALICYKLVGDSHLSYRPTLWCSLPLISMIFAYLGFRGVKHDEEKVRAADRIR